MMGLHSNHNIAIVTINLNNAKGLRETLDSIAFQNGPPRKLVVVDGGSTDGSVACIRQYDSIVTHWVSEKDHGVYHAQNKGWKMVRADYYLFLNSGDTLMEKDSLETLLKGVSKMRKIVYGNLLLLDNNKNTVLKTYPEILPGNYFDYETLPHPATLISRYWLKKMNGFDESLKICSDWKFFRAVFFKSASSFVHVQVPISRFALDGISNVTGAQKIIEKEKELVKKMQPPPTTWSQRLGAYKRLFINN